MAAIFRRCIPRLRFASVPSVTDRDGLRLVSVACLNMAARPLIGKVPETIGNNLKPGEWLRYLATDSPFFVDYVRFL